LKNFFDKIVLEEKEKKRKEEKRKKNHRLSTHEFCVKEFTPVFLSIKVGNATVLRTWF